MFIFIIIVLSDNTTQDNQKLQNATYFKPKIYRKLVIKKLSTYNAKISFNLSIFR